MELVKTIGCTENGGFSIKHYKTSDNIDIVTAIIHNKNKMDDKMLENLCEVMIEEVSNTSLMSISDNISLLSN